MIGWIARFVVLVSVLIGAMAGIVLYANHHDWLAGICREDGVVEWLTAAFYLMAAAGFVWAARGAGIRRIWCWGFAILFFAVAGEEVSWGQRVFGIETPVGLAEVNVQHETNFHNLAGVHDRIRWAGAFVALVICLFVPLSDRFVPRLRDLYQRFAVPIFPLWSSVVMLAAVMYLILPRLVLAEVGREIDEIGEFLLSIAYLAFAMETARKQSLAPRETPHALVPTTSEQRQPSLR